MRKEQIQEREDALSRLENLDEMVHLYSDASNTTKFSAGYIKALNEKEILLAHISPYGKYDGYMVKQRKDIYCVETGGKYAVKLEKLHMLENKKHEVINIESLSLFKSLLDFAKEKNKIVSIELLESDLDDIVGYVKWIDNEMAEIKLVDEYGEAEGKSLIYIKDISYIVCDSENEIMLKCLSEL